MTPKEVARRAEYRLAAALRAATAVAFGTEEERAEYERLTVHANVMDQLASWEPPPPKSARARLNPLWAWNKRSR